MFPPLRIENSEAGEFTTELSFEQNYMYLGNSSALILHD